MLLPHFLISILFLASSSYLLPCSSLIDASPRIHHPLLSSPHHVQDVGALISLHDKPHQTSRKQSNSPYRNYDKRWHPAENGQGPALTEHEQLLQPTALRKNPRVDSTTLARSMMGSPECFDALCLVQALLNKSPQIYIKNNIDLQGVGVLPTVNTPTTITGICSKGKCTLDGKGGSGIFVVGLSGYLTLKDLEITGGSCNRGSAVLVTGLGADSVNTGGKLAAVNVKFFNNIGQDVGGAVSLEPGASAFISDSVFYNNKAPKGGAIYIGGSAKLNPGEPSDNACSARSCITVSNTDFIKNSGVEGGAIFVDDTNKDCVVVGGGQLDCTTCTFVNNTAVKDAGAILVAFVSSGATVNVKESAFAKNKAGGDGGDVALQAGHAAKGSEFHAFSTMFSDSVAQHGLSVAVLKGASATFTKSDFTFYMGGNSTLCEGSCNTTCPVDKRMANMPGFCEGILPAAALCSWIPKECASPNVPAKPKGATPLIPSSNHSLVPNPPPHNIPPPNMPTIPVPPSQPLPPQASPPSLPTPPPPSRKSPPPLPPPPPNASLPMPSPSGPSPPPSPPIPPRHRREHGAMHAPAPSSSSSPQPPYLSAPPKTRWTHPGGGEGSVENAPPAPPPPPASLSPQPSNPSAPPKKRWTPAPGGTGSVESAPPAPPPPPSFSAPPKKKWTPAPGGTGSVESAPPAPPPPPSHGNSSSVTGDPHFVGKHGERFDFHGKDGKDYCVVSDKNVHVNMHVFHGKQRKSTFISKLGVLYRDQKIMIDTQRNDTSEHTSWKLLFNDMELHDGNTTFTSGGVTVTRKPQSVDIYAPGELHLIADIIPATFGKRGSLKDYMNLKFEQLRVSTSVHGLLGQTYLETKRTYQKIHEAKGKKRSKAAHALVDGSELDYRTTDVMSPDCKFASFELVAKHWTKKVQRILLGTMQKLLSLGSQNVVEGECIGFGDQSLCH